MNKVSKTKPNRVYTTDNSGRLQEIQPLEVKHNGTTYGLQLDLYKTLDEKYKMLQLIIENAKSSLTGTLILNGIDNPSNELKSIVEDMRYLKTIIPTREYDVITLDEEGYIVKVESLNGEIEEAIIDYPFDVENGCYKLEDGIVVKDTDKENKLAMVML